MANITDEYMREMLGKSKNYSIIILKEGPNKNIAGVEKIIWEHGRRNFSLRAEGVLSVVCPITSKGSLAGIGIFNASVDEVKNIMEDDPGVKQGIFDYEVYECKSFPGDKLP